LPGAHERIERVAVRTLVVRQRLEGCLREEVFEARLQDRGGETPARPDLHGRAADWWARGHRRTADVFPMELSVSEALFVARTCARLSGYRHRMALITRDLAAVYRGLAI
jgi:hypothetical protein